jgi:hypothetical protein
MLLIERILLLLRNILHVPADPKAEKVYRYTFYVHFRYGVNKFQIRLNQKYAFDMTIKTLCFLCLWFFILSNVFVYTVYVLKCICIK